MLSALAFAGHLVAICMAQFSNPNSCGTVSNYFPAPIEVEGEYYSTVEKKVVVNHQVIDPMKSSPVFSSARELTSGVKPKKIYVICKKQNPLYPGDEKSSMYVLFTDCDQFIRIGYRGRKVAKEKNASLAHQPQDTCVFNAHQRMKSKKKQSKK